MTSLPLKLVWQQTDKQMSSLAVMYVPPDRHITPVHQWSCSTFYHLVILCSMIKKKKCITLQNAIPCGGVAIAVLMRTPARTVTSWCLKDINQILSWWHHRDPHKNRILWLFQLLLFYNFFFCPLLFRGGKGRFVLFRKQFKAKETTFNL